MFPGVHFEWWEVAVFLCRHWYLDVSLLSFETENILLMLLFRETPTSDSWDPFSAPITGYAVVFQMLASPLPP